MALAITTRSSFPHSHSLPSGSFHKPHPYPSEGRQNENQNHRKLINWSHGPQPGLTQWNYEPCHVGPPNMGHGGEFWQNMIRWRREWQTTSVFVRTPWTVRKVKEWAWYDPHLEWLERIFTSMRASSGCGKWNCCGSLPASGILDSAKKGRTW